MTPSPFRSPATPRPAAASRWPWLALAASVLTLALATCGYKGDLVLPDPAAKGAETAPVDADLDAKPSAQED